MEKNKKYIRVENKNKTKMGHVCTKLKMAQAFTNT